MEKLWKTESTSTLTQRNHRPVQDIQIEIQSKTTNVHPSFLPAPNHQKPNRKIKELCTDGKAL